MSDNLTYALQRATQAANRNWEALERVLAERDAARTDRDKARDTISRIIGVVANPPIVRPIPGGNPPGYAGPIHLYDIRDLQCDVLKALEDEP